MKIVVISETTGDDYERQELIIYDEECLWVGPLCDCPEDAIIVRSLVSCEDVAGFMKRAYEAGKSGEDLVFDIIRK